MNKSIYGSSYFIPHPSAFIPPRWLAPAALPSVALAVTITGVLFNPLSRNP
jgi:hypothetical protein